MKLRVWIIYLFAFVALPMQTHAQSLTKDMEDGSIIQIDPVTNKATRFSPEGTVQLWDGTHQMQDGSILIVKDGIVTSGYDSASSSNRTVTPEESFYKPTSACIDLVIKVCGFNGECNAAEACSPAHQMVKLEADEAWQSRNQGPNQTTIECRKALLNEEFFTPCAHGGRLASEKPTPCERLVSHVCGVANQCALDPGCSPARQLLNMELQERIASRDPKRLTYTAKRCTEAIEDDDFFKPCDPAKNTVGTAAAEAKE